MTDTLTIARRFNGPHDSGNGGYSAGLAAQLLPKALAVEATIRAPIPLDRTLRVHPAGDGIDILHHQAVQRFVAGAGYIHRADADAKIDLGHVQPRPIIERPFYYFAGSC